MGQFDVSPKTIHGWKQKFKNFPVDEVSGVSSLSSSEKIRLDRCKINNECSSSLNWIEHELISIFYHLCAGTAWHCYVNRLGWR